MFRTAILRSARVATRSAARWQAPIARPSVSAFVSAQKLAPAVSLQSLRCYSAGAGLAKDEIEGRILDLLKNFDKVSDD
jgi:NADH dehydrogenase (ubiquinone) 1 alpha/beta subcomplex 1, acyl-carrier protein